ncbi:FAD/NAD(P)-binding protein [Streptomyces boluensis]|uniref:Adenylate cyclase n=1 Tax=Streptomyces boluensis TaxID=1775135 RepID=A0A964UR53_9ACTN|nr:FAD/NAD(P)-binding protein [Streptomyces boluensis]NBE53756.1 adenylate cyclase [Streptomyces boluensis]
MTADPYPRHAVLVIVGAGPRAIGLLDRIAANAPELLDPARKLRIHLVDPHPPGPGRVWRHAQSPLLRMNSMAEDVTVFTDNSSTLEGPVRPGPSLAAWAAEPGRYPPLRPPADPDVREELRSLRSTDFPTRRVQGAYLHWAFHRAVADLPPHITVRVHRTTATRLTGPADGPQRVHLADRAAPLEADLVILAQGHLSAAPTPEQAALAAFADRHQLTYQPPEFSADADLSGIAPGTHILLRGFGLAFIDLTALLTEGRGGRYTTGPDGTLTYHPSGREPVLHVGSRRGVPYRSKPGYQLRAERAPLPRYFGPEQIGAAAEASRRADRLLDLRRDIWPLLAKEIGYGYYHELFHAHPDRTTLDWPRFLAAYDTHDWYAPETAALVADAVPDPADRLDFETLDRPLAGLTDDSHEAFQERLRAHIEADVARRSDPAHSADLGAFYALLSVYGQLPGLAATGRLSPDSVARQLDGWWHGFFSYFASGPPAFRLRELLALSRAGVVRFVGAGLEVEADEVHGVFRARSATVPGHTVTATALVEAYLPHPTVERTADPLLAALDGEGQVLEERRSGDGEDLPTGRISTAPVDGRLLTRDGPHPRRIALGAPTTSRAVAAFARPRTDAPAFRQNDAAARGVLRALGGLSPGPPLPESPAGRASSNAGGAKKSSHLARLAVGCGGDR